MRLAIIIPAFNEEKSVARILSDIPTTLPDVSSIHRIVIDDGSTDQTAAQARAAGAQVFSHTNRIGLAAAFRTGLNAALTSGADAIVTLDADGQYQASEIALLWEEMRRTGADLVVGNRCVLSQRHMPAGNRIGNVLGSLMLRVMGVTRIRDASSGFRLFSSELGSSLRIMSRHTYTHEMLIQADAYGFRTAEIPVTFLPRAHGKSKLVRTLRHHILRSCGTIVRSTFLYRPLRKFLLLSAVCMVVGGLMIVSTLRQLPLEIGALTLPVLFIVAGLQFLILGVIAEAFAADRRVAHEHERVTSHRL